MRGTWFSLGLRVAVITGFIAFSAVAWKNSSLLEHLLESAAVMGALVELSRHFSGAAETIEFGPEKLRITKEVLGWDRTAEYPLGDCTDLKAQDETGAAHGLRCRVGKWKTVEFADDLSAAQSERILASIAEFMPEVARSLLPSLDITKHWVTLNLG